MLKNIFVSILIIGFGSAALSSACMNSVRNCVAVGAKKKYFQLTPICEMKAECDSYCGQMDTGRVTKTFYCAFTSSGYCMDPAQCEADTSVIKSEEDVGRVMSYPYLSKMSAPDNKSGVR